MAYEFDKTAYTSKVGGPKNPVYYNPETGEEIVVGIGDSVPSGFFKKAGKRRLALKRRKVTKKRLRRFLRSVSRKHRS